MDKGQKTWTKDKKKSIIYGTNKKKNKEKRKKKKKSKDKTCMNSAVTVV